MVLSPQKHAPPSVRLESGDRLTRAEFHRRYEESGIPWAELIEGVVYVGSPVRAQYHGIPESMIGTWLGLYRSKHPGVIAAHNTTLLLDLDNEFQPDVCMWREGGRARVNDEGYIEGAPELVVEIAASSVSVDMHAKKAVYRRNGVPEYLVWRALDREVDWFVLEDGEYVGLAPDGEGAIESREFPGLVLRVPELLEGDLAAVLALQPS